MNEETASPQEVTLRPLQDVLTWATANNTACRTTDPRDMVRLSDWVPMQDWPNRLGLRLAFESESAPEEEPAETEEWEPYSVMIQALADARFGKSKFDDQKYLSTNLMYEVCAMWAYALGWDDLLETHHSGYDGGSYTPGPFFDAMIARLKEATNVG